MTKRMLIDSTHKEEIRVAITDGNKLAEYEYESQSRKPLKGSIFLAKVTRVEPSLQAAFVNFGGNRHGFLPFSEIHPDYFRIPVADREALMAEQEELLKEHDEEEALEDEELANDDGAAEDVASAEEDIQEPEEVGGEAGIVEPEEPKAALVDVPEDAENDKTSEADPEKQTEASEENAEDGKASDHDNGEEDKSDDNKKRGHGRGRGRGRGRGGRGRGRGRAQYKNRNVEVVGGEDIDQEQRFRFNLRRKYKIQEVIKRGQIMLVQANKEERGNKGAAVGSYLSLPGRYCVLMPNSPRAGGVSRKIANHKDRARMRDIVKSLEVPKGMSVIVRTAGVARTKAEIKRDLDYLMRLWDSIRELTLESTAPSLVYEEADLIKRAVRDLYTRDVEEILVAGDAGYDIAKKFMKMMIPSHVKKVKEYSYDQLPLFNRYQIENQINEIGQPEVRLKSGGYLVINPTEALVSVDVNSGKATKGRHIEETALKTNLEAAVEVARQLKLRDLGGLVVIDFIDMEDRRNNGKVERRMKEALSTDRARVQVGRISSFGLMELSRQRLSSSLTEAQYEKCKSCNGIGVTPTADAMSISVLRAIEEEGIRARAAQVIVQVTNDVALFILNYKRRKLAEIEQRYNFEVLLRVDDTISASDYRIEVSKPSEKSGESAEGVEQAETTEGGQQQDKDKSRRRGRRGGRGRGNKPKSEGQDAQQNDVNDNEEAQASTDQVPDAAEAKPAKAVDKDTKVSAEKDEKVKRKSTRRKPKEDKEADDAKAKPAETEEAASEPKKKERKAKVAPANDVAEKDDSDKKPTAKKPAAKKRTTRKAKGAETKDEGVKKATKEAKPSAAQEHEVLNQAPKEKKRGWWNRLVE